MAVESHPILQLLTLGILISIIVLFLYSFLRATCLVILWIVDFTQTLIWSSLVFFYKIFHKLSYFNFSLSETSQFRLGDGWHQSCRLLCESRHDPLRFYFLYRWEFIKLGLQGSTLPWFDPFRSYILPLLNMSINLEASTIWSFALLFIGTSFVNLFIRHNQVKMRLNISFRFIFILGLLELRRIFVFGNDMLGSRFKDH